MSQSSGWTGDGRLQRERGSRRARLPIAVQLSADGQSDRTIAQALTAAGYRTQGTPGRSLFTKDIVRAMLCNRFYLGELPGERPADAAPVRHQAVIDAELWEVAREMRERRATNGRHTIPRSATIYSLSGIGVCAECGSLLHMQPARGRPRLYCSGRRQGKPCSSHSGVLTGYEAQLRAFLETFRIPADYRERLHAWVTAERALPVDTEAVRRRLTTRLTRLKDVYLLGDLSKEAYLAECDRLKRELAALEEQTHGDEGRLSRLATFLASIAAAWDAALPEQRNRLARQLCEEVVIQDKCVTQVKPRPELCGFFARDYAQRMGLYRTGGPDGHELLYNHTA